MLVVDVLSLIIVFDAFCSVLVHIIVNVLFGQNVAMCCLVVYNGGGNPFRFWPVILSTNCIIYGSGYNRVSNGSFRNVYGHSKHIGLWFVLW